MRDDDLDKGLENIKEILLRLEKQAHELQLLKEFPRPAPAEKPGPPEAAPHPAEAPQPEPQPVQQTAESPAITGPEPAVFEVEPPAAAPAGEPLPELPAVSQAAEAPPPVEQQPGAAVKAAGSKVKILVLFCLGLASAAAVYQFGFNSSAYRFKQAAALEQAGDKTKALAAYERLVLEYPGTGEATSSQYAIGNIQNERGEPGAVESYEKFLRLSLAGDAKIPEVKFKLAELRFNSGDFFVAANLYSTPDVRASVYSQKAQERLDQIKDVEAQAADARKLAAWEPDKAVEAYSAILAGYPAYAEAKAGLAAAREQQLAAKAAPAALHDKAAAARAKLARSILLANRRQLGPGTPGKAEALKTASLKDRYAACSPVWLAEDRQAGLDASLASAKKSYDCGALKASQAVCEGYREKTRAIRTQTAGERAAKVQTVVPGWTEQKQAALDKKMLALYEENRCDEILELSAPAEQEAPEGF